MKQLLSKFKIGSTSTDEVISSQDSFRHHLNQLNNTNSAIKNKSFG